MSTVPTSGLTSPFCELPLDHHYSLDICCNEKMEATVCRLRGNDPTLTEVNLSWLEAATSSANPNTFFYETLLSVADCLATNPHLTSLQLTLSPYAHRHQQQHLHHHPLNYEEDTATTCSSSASVMSLSSHESHTSSSSSSSSTVVITNKHKTSVDLKHHFLLTLALRMRDNVRLERLSLDSAVSTSETLTPLYLLSHDIPLLPNLRHLRLVRCGIGGALAVALGRALARSPNLQTLDVSENRLDAASAKPILESLLLGGSLHTLLLNANPLEAQVVDDVAKVLELNTSLQTLSLHSSIPSNFILDSAQATRLGFALAHNHTLLHLSTNLVDGRPPYLVAQGLAQNTALRSLSWPCTVQELLLSRVLSSRKTRHANLQELSIRTSCATLRQVARSLPKNTTLRKLVLLEPEPTCQDPEPARDVSKAVTRFVEAMSQNVTLQCLEWTPSVVLALEPKEFKERYELCRIIVQAIEAKLEVASFYARLNRCGRRVWHATSSSNTPSVSIHTIIPALLPTVILRAENSPKLIFALLQEAVVANTAAAAATYQKLVAAAASHPKRRRSSGSRSSTKPSKTE